MTAKKVSAEIEGHICRQGVVQGYGFPAERQTIISMDLGGEIRNKMNNIFPTEIP